MSFAKVADVEAPKREAGGDNEVPRDALGRPRIKDHCYDCALTGKVPSPKTGKPIQCPKCKGKGHKESSYTRVTTFIDVLDDKTNLEAWQMRMTLVGVARDPRLLEDVTGWYDEFLALEERERFLKGEENVAVELAEVAAKKKKIKDDLNRKAQIAKSKAGSEDKADRGTHLHALSELVDLGLSLPKGISFQDVVDMDAYRRETEGFHIVHMERLVVNDSLHVAGTPDRVSRWVGESPLIAPDGSQIGPDELLITDLKTGTVEHGGLKMAMQLSIYANSALYDHQSGARQPFSKINRKWGIIMHLAAGTGVCELLWADLDMGWRAVQTAAAVRGLRSEGKKALQPISLAA